jgi:hypothetical protein
VPGPPGPDDDVMASPPASTYAGQTVAFEDVTLLRIAVE